MISKPIDELGKDDIDALVRDKVPELKTLEYKAMLPGNGDGEKKELLADVSSFANAAGGYLIYGVSAERDENNKPTGAPDEAVGLSISSADAEILRLENLARDGIAPRIPGLGIVAIAGFPNGAVIVVHVPRSFAGPHMVTYANTSRFFLRNSAGKYQLDVGEIRSAFAALEAVPQRIRRFREDRLGLIISGNTPTPLPGGPKLIMHMYPLAAIRADSAVDLKAAADSNKFSPMNSSAYNFRYNFDGCVTLASGTPPRGYVQLFRNGCVEAVTTSAFDERAREIRTPAIEYTLADRLQQYLQGVEAGGVTPPVAVMISLLGVEGYRLAGGMVVFASDIFPLDQPALVFPDVLAETYAIDTKSLLRPVFEVMWQASGVGRCPYYDEQGQWNHQ